MASAYIMNGTVDSVTGEKWLEERLGLAKGRPLDNRAVARACFSLDPVSLVHGVFFARKAWPWQPKIARALTSFIEASGILPAVSGGVERDAVINEAKAGATAEGYGTVPHHRVEYTAAKITAYFTVDHAQFRSYGLSEPATALLEALADFEIGTLLDRGLRLRTRCDLAVREVRGERPDASEAARRIADLDPVPDASWWHPGGVGARRVRLLAATRPVSVAALEVSTADVRKRRRTVPLGTSWVSYATSEPDAGPAPSEAAAVEPVTAVRFAVTGTVPVKATHGVLLADEAHRLAGLSLTRAGLANPQRQEILGSNGAATDHRHAHWIPLGIPGHEPRFVRYLIVWVPHGLRTEEVAALLSLRGMSGQRGSREDGYEVRGLPPVDLLFQAAGQIEQVAPELCGPARRWRSLTPYLPVRHRKREPLADYLAADVRTELGYRDLPPAAVIPADPDSRMPDRWALEFRRYRMTENMSKSRPGLGLRLDFA